MNQNNIEILEPHPLSVLLQAWYQEYGRDLPWRHTTDPYAVWISEIILQQTRVAQGWEYYQRFLQRFPDLHSLATASQDEVLRYWQGLGYYSRARNLHAAAQSMDALGHFPTTYEEVRKLKGVGDYTAAAICSIAYAMPYAVVDGNVYRVLARYFDIDTPVDTGSGKKLFAELAQQLLDKQHPARYNQSIMDFGALVCTPQSPSCTLCPLRDSCAALQNGHVEQRPQKSHRIQLSDRYFHYIYVRMGSYILLHQRQNKDVWQHLYEVPLIETGGPLLEVADLLNHPEWEPLDRLFRPIGTPQLQLVRKEHVHVLSHRRIHARFFSLQLDTQATLPAPPPRMNWISMEERDRYAVSRLVSLLFEDILKN